MHYANYMALGIKYCHGREMDSYQLSRFLLDTSQYELASKLRWTTEQL